MEMKAAILEQYNKDGAQLDIKKVEVPHVKANQVLVKVLAAGINPLDNMIVRKEVELIVPYKTPLIMGNELVGIVQQTGSAVKDYTAGDRVYARMPLDSIGAFAEYAAIDQAAIAKVPDYLTDEEAACIPLTALTAWQALDIMDPRPGQSIFISGGTGSVGAMAIPICAARGLRVITNGSAKNEERVRALGAQEFIDYRKQDFADVLHDVDFVLDTLGDKALPKEFQILKEGGVLVSLRGMPNGQFAKDMGMPLYKRIMFGLVGRKYDRMAAKRHQQYRFMFVHSDGAALAKISKILTDNDVHPSVDEVFAFDDVNAGMAKVKAGGSKGKTVLRVAQ